MLRFFLEDHHRHRRPDYRDLSRAVAPRLSVVAELVFGNRSRPGGLACLQAAA
jgi:hypothetical protein